VDIEKPRQRECSSLTTIDMLQLCSNQRPLLAALEDMDTKVLKALTESVSNLFDNMHVTLQEQFRTKRAWIPFLGDIMKTVTGTLTQSDIDRQNQIIVELQKTTAGALDSLAVHTDKLASFMKLSNQRLDQFTRLLETQQTEINSVIDKFKQQFMSGQTSQMMLAHALKRVIDFTLNLEHLNSFEWAVTLAAGGTLTPELIPAKAINKAIHALELVMARLHEPGYLIRTRPVHIYQSHDFHVFIHEPFLLVTVKFPIAPTRVPLTLYQVVTLPTPVPQQTRQFTRLRNLPAAVAYHPDSDIFMVFQSVPHIAEDHLLNLEQSSLLILNKTFDSCMSAILRQDAALISRLCEFEFYDNTVLPQVVHVAEATLLLINVPSYTLTCQNGSTTTYTPPPHIELTVPCSCRFNSAYGTMATRLIECQNSDTQPTVLYPTNFAVLQRFFQQSELSSLTASIAFKEPLSVQLPNISVLTHRYAADLAESQQTALQLDMVANLTQQDGEIFRTLTDKVLFKIDTAALPIESSSLALLSWQNLLLLACSAAILILAFFVYTLSTRLSAVAMTLGLAAQVPHTLAQATVSRNPFNYFGGLTTKIPSLPSLPIEIDYRLPTLDILLLLLLLLTFLILGLVWYRHTTAIHNTFSLMLEIGSPTERLMLELLQVPHFPDMVDIKLSSALESLLVDGFLNPVLHLTWTGLTVHDLFSQVNYPIPRTVKLSWFQAYKLRMLLQQPYYTVLFTYFKRTLRPIKAPLEFSCTARPTILSLYAGLRPSYTYSSLNINQPANAPTDTVI